MSTSHMEGGADISTSILWLKLNQAATLGFKRAWDMRSLLWMLKCPALLGHYFWVGQKFCSGFFHPTWQCVLLIQWKNSCGGQLMVSAIFYYTRSSSSVLPAHMLSWIGKGKGTSLVASGWDFAFQCWFNHWLGSHMPHGQKKQNIKQQKQYCNKFSKDLKNSTLKKKL